LTAHPITRWHGILARRDPRELQSWLDEDAVFLSPVVHTPQRGRALVMHYLSAAFQVLFNDSFRYVREIIGPNDAMLEFEVVIEGTTINGVDLIRWNEAGRVVEFKVMIRPLKAIHLVHERMGSILQASKPPQ
jgi:hypothetical protein